MKGKKLRSRKGKTEHEQVPLQRPSTETVQEERVCYSLLDHNEQDVPKSLLVVSKETFNFRIIYHDDGFGQVNTESRQIASKKAANLGCNDDRERWVSSM